MSVLIKGMEMPTDQSIAIKIHPDGRVIGYYSCDPTKVIGAVVPVPPHGRLIDADALKRELVLDYAYAAADMVDDAPTVIPASEESHNEP